MDIIKALEQEQVRDDIVDFNVGDTVRVNYRIIEGERERIQAFEGTVIKIQGSGIASTFTVRRISYGTGVERTFPVNSPRIQSLEVLREGKVRRAKLFYLRDRVGRSARIKEKSRY